VNWKLGVLNTENLSRLRAAVLGLTGVCCLVYAGLVLATGRPDPVYAFLPATFGILAAIIVTIAFVLARPNQVSGAKDELFRVENARALAFGYWVAVLLYPVFALVLAFGWLSYPAAFAAMGTLTGAAYLLPFAVLTGRAG
jgi:hypothetical protein